MNYTEYKTLDVEESQVFYRESGSSTSPCILLLHGFPTSSHMYRNIIPKLAEQFRVIAPDLPGFGLTKSPSREHFDYTFDNLFKVMARFTEALNLEQYAIFVFDYGAPIGFRLAAAYPDKITAIISQNGNAYEEGLLPSWEPLRSYWQDPSQENRDALRVFLDEDTTKLQYYHGVPEKLVKRISPDAIQHDQAILDRDSEVQLDLFGDYQSNLVLYPQWQAYFRKYQPPFLATWGKNDPFFSPRGAEAYKKDLNNASIHLFETGHFALETHGDEIANIVIDFLLDATR